MGECGWLEGGDGGEHDYSEPNNVSPSHQTPLPPPSPLLLLLPPPPPSNNKSTRSPLCGVEAKKNNPPAIISYSIDLSLSLSLSLPFLPWLPLGSYISPPPHPTPPSTLTRTHTHISSGFRDFLAAACFSYSSTLPLFLHLSCPSCSLSTSSIRRNKQGIDTPQQYRRWTWRLGKSAAPCRR